MNYRLLYFASLAEAVGRPEEIIRSEVTTAKELYQELVQRYGFSWQYDQLRVAVNGCLSTWNQVLGENDEIAFLPPVSGG